MPAPIKWEHPDGRTIEVWEDRKVRTGFVWPDEDAIVYRLTSRTVRHGQLYIIGTIDHYVIDDSEWYAAPGPEWRAA